MNQDIILPATVKKVCALISTIPARPIVVGGFVRDTLMHKEQSKDIDIEVHGLNDIERLKKVLVTLGHVYEVGRSFAVLKLHYKGYDFDISLPRKEIKVAQGHKGFDVTIDSSLDFRQASVRRDFTMNALGFDVNANQLLDPFCGLKDITSKTIKHIDDTTFIEDPLRVLRAVQFATRFKFTLATQTMALCQKMVEEKLLEELPKERIFEEIKKFLLNAKMPSKGFLLLEELNANFGMLKRLDIEQWSMTLGALDFVASQKYDEKTKLLLMLCVLSNELKEQTKPFLYTLTDEKALIDNVQNLIEHCSEIERLFSQKAEDVSIYKLAEKTKIVDLVEVAKALYYGKNPKNGLFEAGEWLLNKARLLGVEREKMPALLEGKDLIDQGLTPSKEFSTILKKAYETQIQGVFTNKKDALVWLKEYLEVSNKYNSVTKSAL